MRTLAIDCATSACSVALFDESTLVAGAYEVIDRGHAERLIPLIATLPDRGRAGRICVSLGPGSFTGVRIGLAAGRALGLAWEAEVLGYPTLALVAAMARDLAPGPFGVGVAMLGGHGEWFVQAFDAAGLPEGDLASLAPDAAIAMMQSKQVAGNAAEALVAQRGSGIARMLLPDARLFPLLPAELLTARLAPLYGRGPDARPSAPRAILPQPPSPGGRPR